jgi:hypothetical protein
MAAEPPEGPQEKRCRRRRPERHDFQDRRGNRARDADAGPLPAEQRGGKRSGEQHRARELERIHRHGDPACAAIQSREKRACINSLAWCRERR